MFSSPEHVCNSVWSSGRVRQRTGVFIPIHKGSLRCLWSCDAQRYLRDRSYTVVPSCAAEDDDKACGLGSRSGFQYQRASLVGLGSKGRLDLRQRSSRLADGQRVAQGISKDPAYPGPHLGAFVKLHGIGDPRPGELHSVPRRAGAGGGRSRWKTELLRRLPLLEGRKEEREKAGGKRGKRPLPW